MSYNFFASSNINFGKDAIATLPDILKELKVKKVMVVCDKMIMEVGIGTKVTAATGMDAITHAVESYISNMATPLSKYHSLEALKIFHKALPVAVADGRNFEAREQMMLGCTIVGYGFSNANLGMVHAIAHTLSAHFGLAHGMANACVLPYVIRYNAESCPQQMVEMAEAIGLETTGNTDTDKYLLADELLRMIKLLGVKTISEQGITEDALDRLAEDALHV